MVRLELMPSVLALPLWQLKLRFQASNKQLDRHKLRAALEWMLSVAALVSWSLSFITSLIHPPAIPYPNAVHNLQAACRKHDLLLIADNLTIQESISST